MIVAYGRLLVLLTGLFACLAQALPENSAVALLSQQLVTMQSISAKFHQQITDNHGTLLQDASGTLSVKRPKKFYWHTEQPYEHLVVTDGSILWLHDIDLDQVSKQAFTEDLDKTPALLLSGEIDQISQQYSVEQLPSATNNFSFKLTPMVSESLFKQLTITFQDNKPVTMSLRDSFDQLTVIRFSEVELNQPIPETLFQFVPPAGIDVIDNEP